MVSMENRRRSNLFLYQKMLVLVTATRAPNFMLVSKSAQFVSYFQYTVIIELFFCKKIPLSRRVGYVMDGWFSE